MEAWHTYANLLSSMIQHWLVMGVQVLDVTPPTYVAGLALVVFPATRFARVVNEWLRYREPLMPRIIAWGLMCSGCAGLSVGPLWWAQITQVARFLI